MKTSSKRTTPTRRHPEVLGMQFPELTDIYDLKKLSSLKNPYQTLVYNGHWNIDILFKNHGVSRVKYTKPDFDNAKDMVVSWKDFEISYNPLTMFVMVKFPIGPDEKYKPRATKYTSVDFRDLGNRYNRINRHSSPFLEQEISAFFLAVIETWKFKHKEAVATMRNKLDNDPDYLAEYNLRHSVDKTQSTIEVLKHLNKLRGAVDSMIAGVQKGYVSQGTYETYCTTMNSLGKDKRPVTTPIQKHFLVKNKKKA